MYILVISENVKIFKGIFNSGLPKKMNKSFFDIRIITKS